MDEFGFGKVYENFSKFKERVLLYETYFEDSNIYQGPLIWSQNKIITKFRQKKWVSFFFLAKCTKTAPKLRKSVIL